MFKLYEVTRGFKKRKKSGRKKSVRTGDFEKAMKNRIEGCNL